MPVDEAEPAEAGSPRAMTVEAAAAMQETESAVMRTVPAGVAAATAPGGLAPSAATPSKRKKKRKHQPRSKRKKQAGKQSAKIRKRAWQ